MIIPENIAKQFGPEYTDFRNRPAVLTAEEQEYFRQTVKRVMEATSKSIPVHMSDHERLPGNNQDALGIHWRNEEDSADEFITIDCYFIHECHQVEFFDAYDLNGESLVSVICHELAHMKYSRHTKYHQALTEEYIRMCTM